MIADTNSILNPVGSIEMDLFHFSAPDIILPDAFLKYKDPSLVLQAAHSSLRELIDVMCIKMKDYDDRSIVIDYKVSTLKEGDAGSGIHGWHLDCTNDIHNSFEPETHLIYSTVIGTEFVINPINAKIYDSVKDVINNEVLIPKVGSICTVHKFTSKVLHSSPILPVNAQRVLIRVTSGFKERIKHEKNRK